MDRRVILVDFYWTRDKDPRIPLGHASILTTLQQYEGLDICPIVVAVNEEGLNPEAILHKILQKTEGIDHRAVDVAIGAYVWAEDLVQYTVRHLRLSGFRGRIILGGPQISYNGEGLEDLYPGVDIFIRGYGEEALAKVVSKREPSLIEGVHLAGTPDKKTQAAVDLHALPSPWLTRTIPLKDQAFIRWETQRGCPFRCAFCQHREPGARLKRRTLSLTRVEREIDLFCSSGVQDIAVLDPIFNMSAEATGILERFAERRFTGRLSLQCRAEAVDEAFLRAASNLDIRLEFGLQTIHKKEGRAIKRNNYMKRVDETLREVRSLGLNHEVSLIFGLPLQTLESFEASLAWCLEREIPVIKAFPLLLLRGTALERNRSQWGLVDSGDAMAMVISSTTFDQEDWRQMAQLSEALKYTEGRHPRDLRELKELAAELEPDIFRWLPAA